MELLDEVRAQLKARTYRPVSARERMIPKPGARSAGWGSRPLRIASFRPA